MGEAKLSFLTLHQAFTFSENIPPLPSPKGLSSEKENVEDLFSRLFSDLFVLQNKVKDEAPEGSEVNVELSIGGGVGDEEDDDEDDGVGVGDDEPVGNVLGKHLDQRVRFDWLCRF